MLTTPGGRSACRQMSANISADSGVVSAGLRTTVLPAASAGAIFHASIRSGKFHGMTWPATPSGRGLRLGKAHSSLSARSEERRVGKECRSRGSREHEKKKSDKCGVDVHV